jgi:hypothetical protein
MCAGKILARCGTAFCCTVPVPHSQKALSIVTLPSKYTRTLTFENARVPEKFRLLGEERKKRKEIKKK